MHEELCMIRMLIHDEAMHHLPRQRPAMQKQHADSTFKFKFLPGSVPSRTDEMAFLEVVVRFCVAQICAWHRSRQHGKLMGAAKLTTTRCIGGNAWHMTVPVVKSMHRCPG